MSDQKYKHEVEIYKANLIAQGYAILTGICFGASAMLILFNLDQNYFLTAIGLVLFIVSIKLAGKAKRAMDNHENLYPKL